MLLNEAPRILERLMCGPKWLRKREDGEGGALQMILSSARHERGKLLMGKDRVIPRVKWKGFVLRLHQYAREVTLQNGSTPQIV